MKLFRAALPLAFLSLALLAGCKGGSKPAVTLQFTPSSAISLDEGQSVNIGVNVGNDTTNSGVTWSPLSSTNTACAGSGCGALTNITTTAVTYTAPSGLSAAQTVTLTAVSKANSTVTQSVTINVVLPPTFTVAPLPGNQPTVLPNGANGIPYTQTITASGGVSPLTFTLTSGSLPVGLHLNSTTGAIVGTPSGPSVAQPNPVLFTLTLTDSGTPAASTSENYSISINPAPPLSITAVSPLVSGFVNASYSATVTTSGGVTPLTWTQIAPTTVPGGAIAGLPPGLALTPSNGVISGVPTLQGSATYPQQYVFGVQVTDSSLPSPGQLQTKQLSITIGQPSVLQIPPAALPDGTAASVYTPQSIIATGGIAPYKWTLIGGQLPAGMTFSSNGTISGVPILAIQPPNQDQFTVRVQDSEVTPQTATQVFTLHVGTGSGNGNNLFVGSYTFLFRGFDSGGSVIIAGTLTADGNGNITSSSEEDINRFSSASGTTIVTGAPISSGTYTLGTDGRGTMELVVVNPVTALTARFDYRIVLDSNGNIRFFEDNSTATNQDLLGTHGEGILKPIPSAVASAGFSAGSFSGNYAFLLTGTDPSGKREAFGGILNAGGTSGHFTNGTSDLNDAGTFSSQSVSGDFTAGSSTRGITTLVFAPPGKSQVTMHFSFYFVTPSDLFLMEVDPDPSSSTHATRLSGEMVFQPTTVSFGQSSLNGSSVVTAEGLNGNNADVMAGLLTSTVCDGSTHISLSYDENNAGVITTPSFASGTCAVGSNGRVVFTGLGASAAQTRVGVAYLTGTGSGFVIGSDAAVTAGVLEQQTIALPATNASVLDGYTLGMAPAAESQVPNIIGQAFSNGTGTVTGTVDENSPPTSGDPEGMHTVNLNQLLTANIDTLAANGRGTMHANALIGFPANLAFYLVSPSSIRLISLDVANLHPLILTLDH